MQSGMLGVGVGVGAGVWVGMGNVGMGRVGAWYGWRLDLRMIGTKRDTDGASTHMSKVHFPRASSAALVCAPGSVRARSSVGSKGTTAGFWMRRATERRAAFALCLTCR